MPARKDKNNYIIHYVPASDYQKREFVKWLYEKLVLNNKPSVKPVEEQSHNEESGEIRL